MSKMNEQILKYKDYIASVHISFADKCLYGKILYIHDDITFEAKDVDELQKSFESAVDSYLESCALIGRQPQKAFSGTFNVRVPKELHKAAAIEAKALGLKLNEFVIRSLECFISENSIHVHHHDHHHSHLHESKVYTHSIEMNDPIDFTQGEDAWRLQ